MARNPRNIRLLLAAVLTAVFLIFTGCSDSTNSPLSLETFPGDLGEPESKDSTSDDTLLGKNPTAKDSKIIETREGLFLDPEEDIILMYNPDDLPPGVEPKVVFNNPKKYQFTIVPPGIVLNNPIRVKIDYSKADLTDVEEEMMQVYGIEGNHLTPISTRISTSNSSAGYKIETFSRYALARD
jgi:hypothetical protein